MVSIRVNEYIGHPVSNLKSRSLTSSTAELLGGDCTVRGVELERVSCFPTDKHYSEDKLICECNIDWLQNLKMYSTVASKALSLSISHFLSGGWCLERTF